MTEYLQSLHKAGIVDVNPIAQFLYEARAGAHDAGAALDPEDLNAQLAAFRLFLSHVVLEHGELWVTEDETGIQAAALWLPSQPQQFGDEVRRVVERELGGSGSPEHQAQPARSARSLVADDDGIAPLIAESVPRVIDIADATKPDLILTDVALAPSVDPSSEDGELLIRELLRPVLGSPAYTRFAALSLDAAVVRVLEAAGFKPIASVPVSDLASLWMGAADFGVHAA